MGSGNDQLWSHGNGWRWRVLDNYVIMPMTINGSGTITGLSAGGLPANSVTAATCNFSPGKILQVVQGTTTTTSTHGAGDSPVDKVWTTTNLTAAITPSAASSKIIATISVVYYIHANGNDETGGGFQLQRAIAGGATSVVVNSMSHGAEDGSDNYGSRDVQVCAENGAANLQYWGRFGYQYLDSPSTTSACTYTVNARIMGTASTMKVNFNDSTGNAPSIITLMELAA